VSAVTLAILGGLATLLRVGRPLALTNVSGTITPEKISASMTVVAGVGMVIVGVWIFAATSNGWGPIALIITGLAIAAFMAPSLTHIHDVQWTGDVIEGPSRLFGPTLGRPRTTIAWHDVVRIGSTVTGYWYVEAGDRRRVYWSYLYKGNGALSDAIIQRCPQLRLPTR